MAQTDARAGFRLPWSSDRSATDETDNANQQNSVPGSGMAMETELPVNGIRPWIAPGAFVLLLLMGYFTLVAIMFA